MKFSPNLYDPPHKIDNTLFSVCINLNHPGTLPRSLKIQTPSSLIPFDKLGPYPSRFILYHSANPDPGNNKIQTHPLWSPPYDSTGFCAVNTFIYIYFCGLGCVGRSFAYVAHTPTCDFWFEPSELAVTSRRATNLATCPYKLGCDHPFTRFFVPCNLCSAIPYKLRIFIGPLHYINGSCVNTPGPAPLTNPELRTVTFRPILFGLLQGRNLAPDCWFVTTCTVYPLTQTPATQKKHFFLFQLTIRRWPYPCLSISLTSSPWGNISFPYPMLGTDWDQDRITWGNPQEWCSDSLPLLKGPL